MFSRSKSHSWIITPYNFLWSFLIFCGPVLSIFHVLLDLTLTTTLRNQLDYDSPFTGEEKDKEKSMEFNEFISLTFSEYLLRPSTAVCTEKRVLDKQSPLLTKLTHLWGSMGREWCLLEPLMPPYNPSANLPVELPPEGFHHLARIESHLKGAPKYLCFLSLWYFDLEASQMWAENYHPWMQTSTNSGWELMDKTPNSQCRQANNEKFNEQLY